MADIRCQNCGKDNPDFLDVCQFCQTPLKPESMVHTGEKPTKKNTGELEGVLPEWLRDARQQARDSADEEAAQAATQPKMQKVEPPDLLAGLAFQASSADDEDVPDWLSSINPTAKSTAAAPPPKPEPETDFFTQFSKSEPTPTAPKSEPVDESPVWTSGSVEPPQASSEKEDLAAWFSQTSDQPLGAFSFEPNPSSIDSGWTPNAEGPATSAPAPKEEEDLSWLHNLEASAKQTDELKTPKPDSGWTTNVDLPSTSQPEQDDLSWLDNLGGVSAPASPSAKQPSESQDDLSWLNDLGRTQIPPQPAAGEPSASKDDLSWLNNLGGTAEPAQPVAGPPSGSQDDLGWLNNLGAVSEPEKPVASQPSGSKDDLSWLNNLGSMAEPVQPVASQPSESKDDLSWLNDFAARSEPAQPVSEKPSESQDDRSWLNDFGGTPETAQPTTSQADDDLGWLNKFASSTEPEQPVAANDFSWLNDFPQNADANISVPFESTSEPEQTIDDPFNAPQGSMYSPSQTAPLSPDAGINSMPDWLRDATQSPSMPLGMDTLDQFRDDHTIKPGQDEPFSWKNFTLDAKPSDEEPLPSKPETPFIDSDMFSPTVDSAPLSSEDVDSLFSMDMPDWLSREPEKEDLPAQQQQTGIHTEDAGALAPVDLPSWVQAMRPMDAAISDTAVNIDNQPVEREGPLAGLRGVIPIAPIGSSQRPKAISLKLQASTEQQSGASLLEQLLATETAPRAIPATSALTSQSVLRWVISALFLIVLGVMLGLRLQIMSVSAAVPLDAEAVSNVITTLPDNAPVLVVMDYEPALAGELEAISGPSLDQLVSLHHPTLSFISTSPNGPALVERLMANAKINKSAPDGLNYQAGTNYFNLGYLPGGESGVLAFVQSPQGTIPDSKMATLSGYAAVLVLTDHAESARIWIEQIQTIKKADVMLTNQPFLVISSAQAGPLLQPYVSSHQVTGLISGLADAAKYEYKNNIELGIARSYWDAFGVGMLMAIVLIVAGSLWSLFTGMRARRAETEQG